MQGGAALGPGGRGVRGTAAFAAFAALLLCLAIPSTVRAAPADAAPIADLADRIAAAWPARQSGDGLFADPVTGKPARGYGAIMLGYGLLSAGARRQDRELVAAGVRAVDTALAKPTSQRGVFDLLGVAAAYDFARRRLAGERAFRRARAGWEEYLRTTGPPELDPAIEGCIRSPGCFHNHEAVEAAADLALLRTGLRSSVAGTKLADRSATRADAIRLAGQEEPAALRATARTTGPGPRRGLGIVSDANTYPLAYHALSTAMLAEAVLALGRGAPPEALRTLRRAVEALAAYAGPDGDVAYLGRRQQQSWALAAAVYAGTAAAAAFGEDPRAAARFRALAARALSRLERVHGASSDGIAVVPRFRGGARGGFIGLDFTNTVVWNGLTVFMLDRASEVAARDGGGATEEGAPAKRGVTPAGAATPPTAPLLTADRDGYFADPAGAGFAAVRRGDVWLAVNARPLQPDLRYDAGLVALKRRGPDGTWRDLLRPRPMTVGRPPSSAGPVLVSAGREWFPYGNDLRVGRRGVVTLRGGFRDAAGADLGRPLSVRYAPLPDGVRISFALAKGETVRMRTFLPEDAARKTRSRAAIDATAVATLRPRPRSVVLEPGFSSCCDDRLVAATMEVTARRPTVAAYTIRDRRAASDARTVAVGVGALAV
ncbi:MAG: hypothetical protein ACR2ML_04985 [Solirubrobacteraceae bacterium]